MTDNYAPNGTNRFKDAFATQRQRAGGFADQAKGEVLGAFGRAVDALEGQIHRAPANLQPQARQAVSVARERPWLTMAGIAAVGLVLARAGRRR